MKYLFIVFLFLSHAAFAQSYKVVTSVEDLNQSCIYVRQSAGFDQVLNDFGNDQVENSKKIKSYTDSHMEWAPETVKVDDFSARKEGKCPVSIVQKRNGADNIYPLTSVRGVNKELCIYERMVDYWADHPPLKFQVVCLSSQIPFAQTAGTPPASVNQATNARSESPTAAENQSAGLETSSSAAK